jgi:hypothetical protein
MRPRTIAFLLLASHLALAVIIDRIAVIVGTSIIKDSDIDRDIRVTSFLNDKPLDLSNSSRKKATDRLIDQVFIRREIQQGEYPIATPQEAGQELSRLKKERFRTAAAFDEALRRDGLTEVDLRRQFEWQLTVLRFIDSRFKPAVLIGDDEIEKYYRDHAAALQRQYPGKSLDDLRDRIRDTLTGQRINQEFFAWLDEQRKSSKIEFREESLR